MKLRSLEFMTALVLLLFSLSSLASPPLKVEKQTSFTILQGEPLELLVLVKADGKVILKGDPQKAVEALWKLYQNKECPLKLNGINSIDPSFYVPTPGLLTQ